MCAVDPLYSFEVSKERLDKLVGDSNNPEDKGMLGTLRKRLSTEQAYNVLFELGMGDAIVMEAQGTFDLRLTDLQLVAYVAALAAVAETGGRMTEHRLLRA